MTGSWDFHFGRRTFRTRPIENSDVRRARSDLRNLPIFCDPGILPEIIQRRSWRACDKFCGLRFGPQTLPDRGDVFCRWWRERSPYFLFFVLLVAPAIFGMASGLIEAGDHVGRSFRKYGLRLPSPEINAWETMFREMPAGSILMVCLADDTWVYGRWVAGSASSQSTDSRDLYLSEVGALSDATYSSYVPQRGVYFSAGEVKRIEVVGNPLPAAIDGA